LLPVRYVAQVTAAVARVTSSCDGSGRPTHRPTPVSVRGPQSHTLILDVVDGLTTSVSKITAGTTKPVYSPPWAQYSHTDGRPPHIEHPRSSYPGPRSPDTGRRRRRAESQEVFCRHLMLICDSRRGYLHASTDCNLTAPKSTRNEVFPGPPIFNSILVDPSFVIVCLTLPSICLTSSLQPRPRPIAVMPSGEAPSNIITVKAGDKERRRIDSRGGAITGPLAASLSQLRHWRCHFAPHVQQRPAAPCRSLPTGQMSASARSFRLKVAADGVLTRQHGRWLAGSERAVVSKTTPFLD
jgi:hypothetical protein